MRGQRDRRDTRLRMRGVRSSRGDEPQRLLHGGGRAGVHVAEPSRDAVSVRFSHEGRHAARRGAHPGRRAGGRLRRPRAIDQERNGPLGGGSGRGARADVRGGARGRRARRPRARRVGTRRYTRRVGEPSRRRLSRVTRRSRERNRRRRTSTYGDGVRSSRGVRGRPKRERSRGEFQRDGDLTLARVVTVDATAQRGRRPRRRKRHVRRVHARPHRRRTREGTLRGGPPLATRAHAFRGRADARGGRRGGRGVEDPPRRRADLSTSLSTTSAPRFESSSPPSRIQPRTTDA